MKKRFLTFLLLSVILCIPSQAWSQYPANLHNESLRAWLKVNVYDGLHSDLGYNLARQEMYSFIDESNGQIECVYTGFKQNASFTTFPNPINTEHLIPQSLFGSASPMRSDIHAIRPTHGDVNAARGVLPFNEVPDAGAIWYGVNATGAYVFTTTEPNPNIAFSERNASYFEPKENIKGDIARQIFYFYTMYPTQAGEMNLVADVNVLYLWHQQDPVGALDLQRNNRIELVQGNRNPYIDYPDLAYDAWLWSTFCPIPEELGASQITRHEAMISWQETGSATLWKLEYGPIGFQQGTGTLVSVLNTQHILTQLSSGTSFEFYVQSNCNPPDGDSDWAGPGTFETLPDYCAGDLFTDSGTATSNYMNNEDEIYVLCPDIPANGGVTLTFTSVDIAVNETGLGTVEGCWDFLTLYNGADTSAAVIATALCGEMETDGQAPFIQSSLLQAGDSYTSTHPGGCLTVRFRSDAFVTEGGWTAVVTCPEPVCLAPTNLDVEEIGFGGSNPRVNGTWNNTEGTASCEVRGGRISDATAGSSNPQFSNIINTHVISQTNGSNMNFNIALYNNPNVPFVIEKTYGYEVRCQCADASGFSPWSGIFPSSTFVVPAPPVPPVFHAYGKSDLGLNLIQSVYPNPSNGERLTLQIDVNLTENYMIELRDISGRILEKHTLILTKDSSRMELEFNDRLKRGIYLLILTNSSTQESIRFAVE
jgi:hypothetical protein